MDLLDFQIEVVDEIIGKIVTFERRGVSSEGFALPCVVFVSAVTGAGKTPILASTVSKLSNSIVLWTTPPASVVSQTVEKLSSSYRDVLGSDVTIYSLEDMTDDAWRSVSDQTRGTSLIVCTVASFNRSERDTNIHKKGRWDRLKEVAHGGSRKRDLYVVYDEAHNLTDQQAELLHELTPAAIIGASGSTFRWEGLPRFVPQLGYAQDRDKILKGLTVKVDTSKVVERGLLKRRIVMSDCHQDRPAIIKAASDKRDEIETLLREEGHAFANPIACFIVQRTDAGVEVWKMLREAGVGPKKIAVHLSNAGAVAASYGIENGVDMSDLQDTYTAGLSPGELRERGFTHIIWNKALKEGWDEPWAFVGYFDGVQDSESDVVQRIGRFIRNPFRDASGKPVAADVEDLYSAYFYLNQEDALFLKMVQDLQDEMELKYPGITVTSKNTWTSSHPMRNDASITVPVFNLKFDSKAMERDFTDKLKGLVFDEVSRVGDGYIKVVNYDVKDKRVDEEDLKPLGKVVHISARQVIEAMLATSFPQVHRSGCLNDIYNLPMMRERIAYSSSAYRAIRDVVAGALNLIPARTSLIVKPHDKWWTGCDTLLWHGDDNDKSIVSSSPNAFHADGYNNLNTDERDVARALSSISDCQWMRNPTSAKGYSIPILCKETGAANFFPDFIAIHDGRVLFIDPKGEHLLKDALASKMTALPFVEGQPECGIYFISASKKRDRFRVFDVASKQAGNAVYEADSIAKTVRWILRI